MAKKKSSSRAHRTPRAVLRLPNQVGGSEQPKLDGCAARIPARNGRVHRVVLLGAATFVQQAGRHPVSHSLGIPRLAPGTINLRLGAVRRLAYEAADCGLLSPDLAAGIRRVKGVKKLDVRLGNWLTPEQSQRLWRAPEVDQLRGRRGRARLAVLLACGVRRHEAVDLEFGRGALGDRRPEGQSRPYADDSEAQLGESACGRLAPSSQPDHR